jgi:hypothetical protein
MKAHVFQEKYTGVQIYIWHCEDEDQARTKFDKVVMLPNNWIFLKTVTN